MECHWWGKCPSTTQACTWDSAFDWHDCQSMHAICTRGNGGGGSGTCRWSHSRSYRQCSKKRAGADPKNSDDPARPAPISAVATSSSRRWKNNLLLKSWRRTKRCTHPKVSLIVIWSSAAKFLRLPLFFNSLFALHSTESNSPYQLAAIMLYCTDPSRPRTLSPHYLYTYYTYIYIYITLLYRKVFDRLSLNCSACLNRFSNVHFLFCFFLDVLNVVFFDVGRMMN